MRLWRTAVGFMLVLASSVQCASQVLKAPDIMKNVERGFEKVQDFVATIEASVDMERVRIPKITATMYFKKPDKVHFSSSSFAMLPREGIVLNPSLLRERYEAKVSGEEVVDGRKLYRLALTAKEAKVRPSQLLLWIDPSVWTIARMETVPYQGRVLRFSFTHTQQAGSFWLPETMKATYDVAAADSSVKRLDLDMPASPQPDEVRRPTRSGSITVKYLDYKVNVGISDDVFEKRDGASKTK
ncbi:MAG: outer membrane lipoprotein-sorting protein [Ignavibacteria bacterium]|nr:outer membrane lipoprotein-sorting protein [Ignavibacteria bacterium]